MARRKKTEQAEQTEVKKYRDRKHLLLLYPEDETHVEAMHKIRESYDYASILHDRDHYTLDDEKLNPEHVAGTLKKTHWHVVLRTSNATWNTAIAKELGLAPNYIRQCKNIDNSLMYLIHYNDIDKAQYDINDVQGSLKTKLTQVINSQSKTEGEKVVELIEYIKNTDRYISFTEFATYCATQGYWSDYRRAGGIFGKILDEHNLQYIEENKESFRNQP